MKEPGTVTSPSHQSLFFSSSTRFANPQWFVLGAVQADSAPATMKIKISTIMQQCISIFYKTVMTIVQKSTIHHKLEAVNQSTLHSIISQP